MDRATFDVLRNPPVIEPVITAAHAAGPDRTLLYGYDCDRDTWHIYKSGDQIHLEIFNLRGPIEHLASSVWSAEDLIPNKRIYPEDADEHFVRALYGIGVRVPFTNFDDGRYERVKDLVFTREPAAR